MTTRKAILIALVLCLTMFTTAVAQTTKEEKPQNSLGAIEKLIGEKKFDEAKDSLNALLAGMPAGWKPVREVGDDTEIAYWDMEHFTLCVNKDGRSKGKRTMWVVPSYSKAYYLLAYIAIESRNAKEATAYIDRALQLEPDHPTLLLEKGLIFQVSGRHEEAIRYFEMVSDSKGCRTDYEKARALRSRGVSLIDLGKLDEAEQAFNESLKIAPSNKLALNELAYIRRLREGGQQKAPLEIKEGK